jgi:hypothetical protein
MKLIAAILVVILAIVLAAAIHVGFLGLLVIALILFFVL